MKDLKKTLLAVQDYNLRDSVTVINILQDFAKQGVTINSKELQTLKDKAMKPFPKGTPYAIAKNLPNGMEASISITSPKSLISGTGWHAISTNDGELYFKKGEAYYTDYQNPVRSTGDTMIGAKKFNIKLHAFTRNSDSTVYMRDEKDDCEIKFDSAKQDIRDLDEQLKDFYDNTDNSGITYTINMASESGNYPTNVFNCLINNSNVHRLLAVSTKDTGTTAEDVVAYLGGFQSLYHQNGTLDEERLIIANPDFTKRFLDEDSIKYLRNLKRKGDIYYMSMHDKNGQISFKTKKGYYLTSVLRYDTSDTIFILQKMQGKSNSYVKNLNGEIFNTVKITDQAVIDDLVAYMIARQLEDMKHHHLNSKLAAPIARMIYIQQKQLSQTVTTKDMEAKKVELSQAVSYLLKHLSFDRENYESDDNDESAITIGELVKYMEDVLNNRPVDRKMFSLIAQTKDTQFASDAATQQAYDLDLSKKLRFATKDETEKVKEIMSNKDIKKVYKIDDGRDLGNMATKTLVHGTSNISVLNIIGQGLLDSDTLRKRRMHNYNYTASGLGRGVYFARPDQVEKSLNYTHAGSGSAYVFIAKVGYHKVKDINHYDCNLDANGADLVWAHGVGSYDRDELLCKNNENIKLEYLIEY